MSDLSPQLRYHSIQPQSIKTAYSEFDNLDFLIACGPGRSLVQNSVRILGDVKITSAANTRTTGGRLFDPRIGAHAFIESLQVTSANQGMLENIGQSYARYVGMAGVASLSDNDYLNAKHICELKAINENVMVKYANGIAPQLATATAIIEDADFSIKPMCSLNKTSGGNVPFNTTGTITLTLNLARQMSALYGQLQDAASGYELSNVRVTFNSMPDSKSPQPLSMRTIHCVKSNILSGSATVSVNVNAVCDAVSISLLKQSNENQPQMNNYALEHIKDFNQIQYLFNDQTNSLVTYRISDQTEVLQRFVDSMYDSGHNQVALSKIRGNNGWGMGLSFETQINLAQNTFTVELESGVGSGAANEPYAIWFYFHSSIQL
tara:strand:- start:230 stop:1363 length:1134 start_codon:yes stop_codon:yes gene_type:complete